MCYFYDAIKEQGMNDELLLAFFILYFINISVDVKIVKRGNDSVFFILTTIYAVLQYCK